MFALDIRQRQCLLEIKAIVLEGQTEAAIIRACEERRGLLADPSFAMTYAAMLLATRQRIAEAIALFSRNTTDAFCTVLRGYLERTQAFSFGVTIFAEAAPYRAWFASHFHRQYQPGFVQQAAALAQAYPPPETNAHATILDVGTGNGELLAQVVNRVSQYYPLESVHLILVDPSPAMLAMAEAHCRAAIRLPITVTTVCGRLEAVTAEQWQCMERGRPIWFTTMSLSVHHMPYAVKIPMFQRIRALSRYFLLGEANWNDELPKDSPELAYVIAKAYGLIFEDILQCPASPEDQQAAIDRFLLPEAISILTEEIGQRTDYHMSLADWERLATETGFTVQASTPIVHLRDHPIAFVSQWLSEAVPHVI